MRPSQISCGTVLTSVIPDHAAPNAALSRQRLICVSPEAPLAPSTCVPLPFLLFLKSTPQKVCSCIHSKSVRSRSPNPHDSTRSTLQSPPLTLSLPCSCFPPNGSGPTHVAGLPASVTVQRHPNAHPAGSLSAPRSRQPNTTTASINLAVPPLQMYPLNNPYSFTTGWQGAQTQIRAC